MKFPTQKLNENFKNSDPLKGIVSIWGDFGVGKTTFALQTAINTAKMGNQILYIYTKPNFPSEKINMIQKDSLKKLVNIKFIQTNSFHKLKSIVFNFEFLILKYLQERKFNLNLIVIDSLTDLYRIELNKDKKEKNYNLNYQLNQILATLYYINETYSIEIMTINEISRINLNNQIIEVQSGGKVMHYWVDFNVKISRTEKLNEREFILTKNPEIELEKFTSYLTETGFK